MSIQLRLSASIAGVLSILLLSTVAPALQDTYGGLLNQSEEQVGFYTDLLAWNMPNPSVNTGYYSKFDTTVSTPVVQDTWQDDFLSGPIVALDYQLLSASEHESLVIASLQAEPDLSYTTGLYTQRTSQNDLLNKLYEIEMPKLEMTPNQEPFSMLMLSMGMLGFGVVVAQRRKPLRSRD